MRFTNITNNKKKLVHEILKTAEAFGVKTLAFRNPVKYL